jgi:hypothetical protein
MHEQGQDKEGIFVSSQVKQLFQDPRCRNQLNFAERRACETIESICSNFLGNKKSENYVEIVEELLSSYCAGAVCDEHGEGFRQDISPPLV